MERHVRLPAHIKPLRYKLLIKPDLERFTFEGEEKIALKIEKSTNNIVLHSKELEIFDVQFQISKFKFQTQNIQYDQKAETATFVFHRKLPKGRGELSLKFKGILNDKMRGFYRSRYVHRNREKHIATTQFEATDARRAFPCFDEPHQKAIFDVTIMVPPGMTAISNTIESSIKNHESGFRVVQFAPTPKMSTYLVAFIVGEFEYIEGWAKRHPVGDGRKRFLHTDKYTLVRVFTTPGKKHQAKFALECAIKTLEFYNRYFDIPYPLPILDLIAIPDFSHGAMENWGAITYRENAILVDPEHSSASNKQWVALVIAHELAHQWFGNLVTMHWWTDLWLNEGFASYIEYVAVNHLFPHWDIWTQFAYNDLGAALKLDALKSTHAIEIDVRHPDEISEIFDEVSYSKGASVIRMLADYLGEKDFRNGLRYYLKKHAYKNTRTTDLWAALEKVSKKPVSRIMRNWTRKAGYPLIRLTEKPNGLVLSQSRFYSSPLSKLKAKDRTVWSVPIKLLNLETGKQIRFLLTDKHSYVIKYNNIDTIKLNAGETGFFRTDYPAQLLRKFYQPIKTKQLRALDRLGLIRDAFALAESGDLPTPQALELCKLYVRETDYTVWTEIVSGLEALRNLLVGQKCYENFERYARALLSTAVKTVGWKAKENQSHTFTLLRSLILHAAGTFGHQNVIKTAQDHFRNWMFKQKPVPADLRGVVYLLCAQNGGRQEHQFLIKKYLTEALQEEKARLGRALGQFKDDRLIQKTLEFALSRHVRYQDAPGFFYSVWNNPYGRIKAWEFTKKHWSTLLSRYPASSHMLNKFIKPMSNFTHKRYADEINRFFKIHKAPGAKRTIEQVLEKILFVDAWLKRDLDKIENWLKRNS